MSEFNGQRLDNSTFKLDVDRMRRGWYSDKYFTNIAQMLTVLVNPPTITRGKPVYCRNPFDNKEILPGDLEVEMQFFTRGPGRQLRWAWINL